MTYFIESDGKRYDATDEQTLIIDAALRTKDNLLINALAGAAKSTTLQFICKYLTGIPILSLAFNKRIATELSKKLPSHVSCMTLNAIGHRTWATALGARRLILDKDKTYRLIRARLETIPKRERHEYHEQMSEIRQCIRKAMNLGFIPSAHTYASNSLVSDAEFWAACAEEIFNEDVPGWIQDFVESIILDRIAESYNGTIDFDDQIYMPTLFGGQFPRFPLVMVDEAQDLSRLNHAMLKRLVTNRLIAVGDPWQSIYGFRGAVSSGMDKLKSTFSMSEFTLSVSFRCPQSIIRKAWGRVPHMRWPEWAIEGEVNRPGEWSAASIPDNSAIICRNNAPLLSLALALIKAGRGIQLVGFDIGPSLIKILKKLGPESMTQAEVHVGINKWEAEKLEKAKNKGSIADRADCLRIFADAGPSLAAAIAYAEHLFDAAGPIQLLSGHKSKGLEWDVVYHLDPWRIPSKYVETPEQREQELNVRYVIETRAKHVLNLVNYDDFRA